MDYAVYTIDGSSDSTTILLGEENDVALTAGDRHTAHIDLVGGSALLTNGATEEASQKSENVVLIVAIVGVLASAIIILAIVTLSRKRKRQ